MVIEIQCMCSDILWTEFLFPDLHCCGGAVCSLSLCLFTHVLLIVLFVLISDLLVFSLQ